MKQYSIWDAEEFLYIDCLYLDSDYSGNRIEEALVNCIKEFGRQGKINLVQWQTPYFNVRAKEFYKRIGASSKSKKLFFLPIQLVKLNLNLEILFHQ